VRIDTPAAGLTADARPVIGFSTDEPGTYEVTIDGTSIATGTLDAAHQGTATPASPLADGDHVVVVSTTDAVGNTASATVTIHVDATAPAPVRWGTTPSPTTQDGEPTITFEGDPGTTFRCRVDGGAWRTCTSPLQLSGLRDGPHQLEVEAVDAAGNVSKREVRTWTVDRSAPGQPTLLSGPADQTTDPGATFELSPESGTTLECSTDDGPWVPCATRVELGGLGLGGHVLRVRQIDAAGNVGSPAEYRWTVVEVSPPPPAVEVTPKAVKARVAASVSVEGNRTVRVGCRLDQPGLRSCTVKATYTTRSGKRITIGTGRVAGGDDGTEARVVALHLNAAGRRMLRRARHGLPVRLSVAARVAGGKVLRSRTTTRLRRQGAVIVPLVAPFELDSDARNALINPQIRRAAAALRHARVVTCVGFTDSWGTAAYNHRLGLSRAQRVCAALRALGVKAKLRARSLGESRPRATNLPTLGRRLTRRVALRVKFL
jgi:outer membrane protein OmpA-like peptidoglycan-associated protein